MRLNGGEFLITGAVQAETRQLPGGPVSQDSLSQMTENSSTLGFNKKWSPLFHVNLGRPPRVHVTSGHQAVSRGQMI